MNQTKTVAIVGAGPVGLAAAAHVLERGLTPIVLEAGSDVGHAVRQWGHVQLFSPWEYNIDSAAARLLASTGWNSPEPEQYPTGAELVERYLEPLAAKTRAGRPTSTRRAVSPISAASASTSSRARAAKQLPSNSAIRTGRAPGACGPMPSSTRPAPGIRRIRPAPTACAPSAKRRRRTGLPTACRTCWARTARAMPARPSRCSAPDIRRSAR